MADQTSWDETVICPSCGQPIDGVPFWVDAENHAICIDGRHIKFTAAEFTVFNLIYARCPKKVSTFQISVALWDDKEPEQADNNIKVYMSKIRNQLQDTRMSIVSIWGDGYRMVMEKK